MERAAVRAVFPRPVRKKEASEGRTTDDIIDKMSVGAKSMVCRTSMVVVVVVGCRRRIEFETSRFKTFSFL